MLSVIYSSRSSPTAHSSPPSLPPNSPAAILYPRPPDPSQPACERMALPSNFRRMTQSFDSEGSQTQSSSLHVLRFCSAALLAPVIGDCVCIQRANRRQLLAQLSLHSSPLAARRSVSVILDPVAHFPGPLRAAVVLLSSLLFSESCGCTTIGHVMPVCFGHKPISSTATATFATVSVGSPSSRYNHRRSHSYRRTLVPIAFCPSTDRLLL
ncbi:hypothetical protein FKP32DRAFT_757868 [Trametes sanguinea]|nr:hypothetical protein FKP32DRAFT_757868 [Trametes sanguinea]